MADNERKFTWGVDDVVFDRDPNPSAKPIIAPEDMDEARKQLQEWLDADSDDGEAEDAGEFHESDHPRAEGGEHGGQFVAKGSGSGGGKKPREAAAQRALASEPDRSKWPAHIKKLKIPPAWTDVRISTDPKAPLQAVGKDAKGRAQYVYSAKFRESQSAKKFARIKKLASKYGAVVQQNDKGLSSKNSIIREHATVTALILETGLRPGSERDTGAEKQAYGATTLTSDHIVVDDRGDVRLQFTGKKGVDLNIPVADEKLAQILLSRKKAGGPLFPDVSDASLRKYVGKLGGGGFKTKDLRTLKGTSLANDIVLQMEAPTSMSAYKKSVRHVAEMVSRKLGNTPVVALQSYISPTVFAPWQENLNGNQSRAA